MSEKIVSALAYGLSSIAMVFANKIILHVFAFPSPATLALGQMATTFLALWIARLFGLIHFPDPVIRSKYDLMLPFLNLGNVLSGLYGTKALSMPMLAVLRRTTILMTMILETRLLNVEYSYEIKSTVVLMMIGSIIAAARDVQFDANGYLVILMNNLLTSLYGVVMKMKLVHQSPWTILYFNSLIGAPAVLAIIQLEPPWTYDHWHDPLFILSFMTSMVLGVLLPYFICYCTQKNSPLTTVVVGVLKNMITTYVGMLYPLLGYTFDWLNFCGVSISMLGGVWYAHCQYKESQMNLPR